MKKKHKRTILNLPDDLIAEILSRLPVNPLLKFRCVSKSWLSLISSKQFAKHHLQISSKNINLTNQTVTFFQDHLKHIASRSLINEPDTVTEADLAEIHYPVTIENEEPVAGCFNGLVCLLINDKDFMFWNPFIRKFKILPPMHETEVSVVRKGFGYDESNDDYKVFACFIEDDDDKKYTAKLYSSKTNSWKVIPHVADFLGDIQECNECDFINGKLHWVRMYWDDKPIHSFDIVSLDLRTEVFGFVGKPSLADDCHCRFPVVGELGGRLYTLCHKSERVTDVWLMKEYGVQESWCKVASVGVVNGHGLSIPVCITPDGDVMLIHSGSLHVYHTKDNNALRYVSVSEDLLPNDDYLGIYGYVQRTLVWPFADGEPEKD